MINRGKNAYMVLVGRNFCGQIEPKIAANKESRKNREAKISTYVHDEKTSARTS